MFVFEDNFDFKSELLKEDVDEITCLISGSPLENPIKLTCGHEFNFEPLFKDVFNQKINPQFKNDIQLKVDQFKCPYCRKLQNTLLPNDEVKIFKVTTTDSDYEVYPSMFLNKMYELGKCSAPYCTKKYVLHKSQYKINLCCIHEKITIKEMINLENINKYMQMYPTESLENIILKIKSDKEQAIIDTIKAKEEKIKIAQEKAKLKEEKKMAAEEKKKIAAEKKLVSEEKKKIAAEKKIAIEAKKKIAEKLVES